MEKPCAIPTFTQSDVEELLLPIVQPAPSNEVEKDHLVLELFRLVRQAVHSDFEKWERETIIEVKDKLKKISKAAELLSGCEGEFYEISIKLREFVDSYPPIPTLPPRQRGRPLDHLQAFCMQECRIFLITRDKRASIGETGYATRLATAVWNLVAHYTMGMDKVTPTAMAKHAERAQKRRRLANQDKNKRKDDFWEAGMNQDPNTDSDIAENRD